MAGIEIGAELRETIKELNETIANGVKLNFEALKSVMTNFRAANAACGLTWNPVLESSGLRPNLKLSPSRGLRTRKSAGMCSRCVATGRWKEKPLSASGCSAAFPAAPPSEPTLLPKRKIKWNRRNSQPHG